MRQDRSRTIRKAFTDIQVTMLITLVLVVAVIYLFLHNASATLIPALALPFSILGTFAVMQVLGFSLNNLSMMALILSIGFVVDDAIVMLENIVRHIENGEKPYEAALKGSKEIGFTILTMTTSLAAVFIPILFMAGILGRLFREFAVTITAAILISGLVSITLTPMLCSRFLRVVHSKKGFAGLMDRAFEAVFSGYRWSLGLVLRHRIAMVFVFVGVLAGTVKMYGIVPKGFIPDQDNDFLFINMRAAQGTSFYDMSAGALRAAEIIKRNPYIDSFVVNTGGGGNGANQARIQVQLLPRANRPVSAQQIAAAAAAAAAAVPELPRVRQHPAGAADRRGARATARYNVTVQSADTDELYLWAQRLSTAMESQVPEIQDVSNDLEIKSPKVNLVIDRDKAAAVGLNATQIQNVAVGGLRPQVVVHDLRRHDAVPRAARARSEVPAVRRFAREAHVQDAARRAHPAARPSCPRKKPSVRRASTTPASCRRCRCRSGCARGVSLGTAVDQHPRTWPATCCRRRSRSASKARPRSSRNRRRTSACCSSSPSAWSTSCWARCTRATSTRSRFCRACRRRALARSSRCGCSATS